MLSGAHIAGTGSFRYDTPGTGLKSTQQIPLDFSKFENHTFFNSAEAQVNVSFDQIINSFPFDGTRNEMEVFLDTLTGFEKYVYDSFPKHKGYLLFSGTNLDASDPNNPIEASIDRGKGTFIEVKNSTGHMFPGLSTGKHGLRNLNQYEKSVTIEMHIAPSLGANDNQVIVQKKESENAGVSLFLSHSENVASGTLVFLVSSGTQYLSASMDVQRGSFNFISAQYIRKNGVSSVRLFKEANLVSSSSLIDALNPITISETSLFIGSGSSHQLSNQEIFTPKQTFSGAMDDLRLFHTPRSPALQKSRRHRNVWPEGDELALYLRFNEPSGTYSMNDLVLDGSGNSFHSLIQNYSEDLRGDSQFGDPMPLETPEYSPVLFPDYPGVVSLNQKLLTSASEYDANNPNLVTKLIPRHYLLDSKEHEGFVDETGDTGDDYGHTHALPRGGKMGAPHLLASLLFMWSKQFDEIKMYIDHFSNLLHVDWDSRDDVVADPFLPFLADYYSFELPNAYRNASINQFIDAEDIDVDPNLSQNSLRYVQNQIWRRMLTNLQEIMRAKGTHHAIRSLIRTVGINPDKMFRFREYGGIRHIDLKEIRERKVSNVSFLNMSGSADDLGTLGDNGIPKNRSFLMSPFLSGSRIEPGYPPIASRAIKSSLIDAIDTTGYSNDDDFNIVVPAAAGGDGVIHNIIIKSTSVTAEAVNDATGYAIVNAFSNDAWLAARIADAINQVSHSSVVYGTGNVGSTGPDLGVTATVASNKVSLEVDTGGDEGNVALLTQGSAGFAAGLLLNGVPAEGGADAMSMNASNLSSDGLFTSGSWTYEALYRFDPRQVSRKYPFDHPVTQSLVRMNVTGSTSPSNTHGVIANLVALAGDTVEMGGHSGTSGSLNLFVKSGKNANNTADSSFHMNLAGVNIFDGNPWYVSFGRKRSDNPLPPGHHIYGLMSSSYFLRVGRQVNGEIEAYSEKEVYFKEDPASGDLFNNTMATYNASGSFLTIGSQSLGGREDDLFLNSWSSGYTNPEMGKWSRMTEFSGEITNLRFWSFALDAEDTEEHIRNPNSMGVRDPTKNFNFVTTASGSFGRMRINYDMHQKVTSSRGTGDFEVFDFTQNNMHMLGTGFEPDVTLINPTRIDTSIISPKWDEATSNQKVRAVAYERGENVEKYNAVRAPVYEPDPAVRPNDDPRFSIEASMVRAINEDIINMFSTLESIDNAVGNPELLFAIDYPSLTDMRTVYFNRLEERMNIKTLFSYFKWFDDTLGTFIERLIPRKTKFLGVNFVIESHMLERAKMTYEFEDVYLGENDRHGLKGTLHAQQLSGIIKKF
jgi:hypothetical protein